MTMFIVELGIQQGVYFDLCIQRQLKSLQGVRLEWDFRYKLSKHTCDMCEDCKEIDWQQRDQHVFTSLVCKLFKQYCRPVFFIVEARRDSMKFFKSYLLNSSTLQLYPLYRDVNKCFQADFTNNDTDNSRHIQFDFIY